MMFTIEIRNAQGQSLARAESAAEARLVYRGSYAEGDAVVFSAPGPHMLLQVDQAVPIAPVYMPQGTATFVIPFGDARNGYAPQAFAGDMHVLSLAAQPEDMHKMRRNLAYNPAAQHEPSGLFPFASANVETRGEAQFWARNAIDGVRCNDSHGPWPYHSWGIGERRDAWLRIEFGRPVAIDSVALTLRADFPHDAWWEQGTLDLSDGTTLTLPLVKTAEAQHFPLGSKHTVTWVCLRELIKADDPSPFPALTQLEVFGCDE